MVFVKTEDGKIYGPVESWLTLHLDKKIKSITLTDGQSLSRNISGYDSYLVEREAVTGMSFGGGPVSEGIVKESVICVKDMTEAKKDLLNVYNLKIKELSEKDGNEFLMERCKSKYEDMIKYIENYEITIFSLIIDTTQSSLRDYNLNSSYVKGGVSKKISASDILGKHFSKKIR